MTDIAKIRTGKVKGTMNSNNLSDYYYNHSFMERLRKRLPEILPNTYCIVAIDIEHFRLFNKLYGRSSGDEVTCCIECSSITSMKNRCFNKC